MRPTIIIQSKILQHHHLLFPAIYLLVSVTNAKSDGYSPDTRPSNLFHVMRFIR